MRDQIRITHNCNTIPSSLDFIITFLRAGNTTNTSPDQPGNGNVAIRGVPAYGEKRNLEVRGTLADAKKAETASEVPRRMPRPLLRMGKLASFHCVSVSDELVMELTLSRNKSSKVFSAGCP